MAMSIHALDRACMAGLLLVCVAGASLTATAAAARSRRLRAERRQQEVVAATARQARGTLDILDSNLAKARLYVADLPPDDADGAVGAFLSDLDQRVKKLDAALVSVQPSPAVVEQSCRRMSVSLSVRGGFTNLCCLIRDLEARHRMMEVESLAITRTAGRRDCQADMKINLLAVSGGVPLNP